MAKKQSKVKPFVSRVNPEQLTRKGLESIMKNNSINKYDYTDSDVETSFGVIKMRECEITDLEYGDNMPLVYDTDSIQKAMDEGDWIEAVVLLEKAIEKHPKAVLFYFHLAESYTNLKEYEKAVSVAEMNYSLHKGLPLIDIAYMTLGSEEDEDGEDINDYFLFYNEKQFNIHDSYPKRKYFHLNEIVAYYCHLGENALDKKDISMAEQCLAIVNDLHPQSPKGNFLKMLINQRKNPIKTKLKSISTLVVLLGIIGLIIGLIIWGIYRLFTWIF